MTLLGAGCNSAEPEPNDACAGACGANASCDDASSTCYCDAGSLGDPLAGCRLHEDMCAQAQARVGHPTCEHEIRDDTTWTLLSIGHSIEVGLVRGVKYLVPAVPEAPLPVVFGDTNWYRFHYCLMAGAFEPLFPAATYEDYERLVIERPTQQYFGGTISELARVGSEPPQYVFTIETRPREDAQLTLEEIHGVYLQLRERFSIGALSYTPDSPLQAQWLDALGEPPFPVLVVPEGPEPPYEAYTPGLAYGRVRRLTSAEIDGDGPLPFGWQDVVVVDQPPQTLAGVMAASVTAARQDVLTHLNVLSSLRGTPNIHVENALEVFEPYEGKLVRIEALPTYYSIREATLAEAQAHWSEHRPHVEPGAPPDFAFTDIVDLDDVEVGGPEDRLLAVSRFGSKAAGLAVLRAVTEGSHVVEGMGLPMGAYVAFMADNQWEAPVAGGSEMLSYAETIERWLADEGFRTDAQLRLTWLVALRDEMEDHGVVDPALLDELRTRVGEVFGDEALMMRFRSSSNAEDSLDFNGAGLYESASGCALDVGSDAEVSACDPSSERKPMDAALKKVWASLWGFGAFEEREYYQIDHRQVGMGMLVNPRFADEAVNGVAFTGNPSDLADPRLTINAQLGEVPVVDATPGVVAELDRVRLEGGLVVAIDREIASTLVPAGSFVLDDARVKELATLLSQVAASYPVDGTPPAGTRVMLDTEFKVTVDGALVLKQIRPFAARPYVPGGDQCR
jgi:hypothetical protein